MANRTANRSRSRSPNFRSRSKSPGEWKIPERRGNDRSVHDNIKLYISNLPYEVKWQELKDLFKNKVGNDVSFAQLYDGPDGKPSGAGVVEVKTKEAAENAIQMLDRFEYKGRKIIVREERERDRIRHVNPTRRDHMGRNDDRGVLTSGNIGSNGGSSMGGRAFTIDSMHQLGIEVNQITNQVFVANLDYKVTKTKLEEVFRIAGNVIEAEIKTDKEGKSRGMGIVRFEHPIEAVQAISLFTNQYLYDRALFVRMDKWLEPIMQDIPNRLPNGLRGMGTGMGANGQPLLNIGEIANTITLSLLTGQLGNAQLGLQATNVGLGGNNPCMTQGINLGPSANLLGALPGLLGSGGLSNLGSANSYGGSIQNQLLNQSGGGGGGLAQTAQQAASVLLTSLGLNALAGMGNVDVGSNIGNGLGGGAGGGAGDLSQFSGSARGGGLNPAFNLPQSNYDSQDLIGFDRPYDRIGGSDRGISRTVENSTIFVKNIPFNFSTEDMYNKFRDCGDIKYAEIKTDGSGRSRGHGVVQFYSSDGARRAISLMNGARVDGRQIEVRLDRLA